MAISLDQESQKFVDAELKAGRYASAEEVVRSALAIMQTHQVLDPDELDDLRADAAIGIGQADRGEFVEFTADDIIRDGKATLASRQKAG